MAKLPGRVDVNPGGAQDTRAHTCHPAGMRRQEAQKPKASLGYMSHLDHLPILGAAHSRFNACIMCRCGSVPANKHHSHCTSVSPGVSNVLHEVTECGGRDSSAVTAPAALAGDPGSVPSAHSVTAARGPDTPSGLCRHVRGTQKNNRTHVSKSKYKNERQACWCVTLILALRWQRQVGVCGLTSSS